MKKEGMEKGRKGEGPAGEAVHISERDRADLERFRAGMAKLNARQKGEVIRWMLVKPDTQ